MREITTVVTRKGQVTVPVEIRRALGIQEGDKVAFRLEDDQVRLRRVRSIVAETAGIFKGAIPSLSAEELRQRAEEAIAEDVVARSNG